MLTRTGNPPISYSQTRATHAGARLLARLLPPLLLIIALLSFQPAHAQSSAQGDSNAYVEATVNNTNPYLGEELTYIFRYYEAVDAIQLPNILVGQPDYDAPEFANFWQEGEITQINYQQRVNDRLYNVSELHTTIFPTAAGDLTIPPAKLILDGGFSGRRIELITLPVTVSVRSLPNGDADIVTGAVGNYTLTAQVDNTVTQVDEPITLQLQLRGTGNIRLAPAAPLPALDGWRIMEQGTQVSVEPLHGLEGDSTETKMGGTRTATYLLIPSEPGVFTIPAIEYAFFDPAANEVKHAFTNPIELTVQPPPGAILADDAQPANAQPDNSAASAFDSPLAIADAGNDPAASAPQDDPNAANTAISPTTATLMTPLVVGALRRAAVPITGETWYWALWSLPVLAVGIAGWASWRMGNSAQRQARHQRAHAGSEALRQMHGQHTASPAEIAAAAQKALLDFIARKLNQPIMAMPRNALAALLVDRGVQPALAQQVVECMHLGDMVRFSPAGFDAASAMQMQATVEATIRDLDKVL